MTSAVDGPVVSHDADAPFRRWSTGFSTEQLAQRRSGGLAQPLAHQPHAEQEQAERPGGLRGDGFGIRRLLFGRRRQTAVGAWNCYQRPHAQKVRV